jgi:hypothetical protein
MGPDEVADHLPRGDVKSAFWSRAHSQRDRALWTKADTARPGLVPRTDTDRLREHVERDGLLSSFDLLVTP